MRLLFSLLTFCTLLGCATATQAMTLSLSTECDTIITTDGQMLFVVFSNQDHYEMHYTDCDDPNGRMHHIAREKVRSLKLTKRDIAEPSAGLPPGAKRKYSASEKIRKDSWQIFGLGISAFILYVFGGLAATVLFGGVLFFFLVSLCLSIACLVKGAKFFRKIAGRKEAFQIERLLVLTGMISSGILGLLLLVGLFVFAVIYWLEY
jgi:hypothetical protein